MILIADSGSTKTAWCLTDGKSKKSIMTQGINPFLQSEQEISAILHNELFCDINLGETDEIYFYGAGCTPEKSGQVSKALRLASSGLPKISVGSDLLGAARSLCGTDSGIVCILGTGSNSCYFDGNSITDNVPPLGFILGDEGSGAYIGRRLVGGCLKKQFSDTICRSFLEETKLTVPSIIEKVYRQPMPNRFLASLSPFCARHRDDKEIHNFIVDCFKEFFKRNVAAYKNGGNKVHFIGSIAWFYRHELREAAETGGYSVGKICQTPMDGLVKFHLRHKL